MRDLAGSLGDFASSASVNGTGVVATVSEAFANAIGLMTEACDHPAAVRARRAVRPHLGAVAISVVGKRQRIPAPAAVLSNGVAVHVEDFDDTCLPSILHPSSVVIPAAIAAGELRGASGRRLVDAAAVGMEVAIRIADGTGGRAFDRGWHITGIIGPIGAAAAAGRLLGLDAPRMSSALSIAAFQGAGVQAALGSMTKSLHPGRAALNGLEAAYLAAAGLTAGTDLIGGRHGLGQATADYIDFDVATDELGAAWRSQSNLVKPYACGVVSHPAIAAARNVRKRLASVPSTGIRTVRVMVNPRVMAVMGVREPRTGLQAKFSVYHAVAVALLDGAAGVQQFRAQRVRSADVCHLRSLVEVQANPKCAVDEAELVAELSDGSRLREHVSGPTMTSDDIDEKVRALVTPRMGAQGAQQLISMVRDLEHLPHVAALLDLACGRKESREGNGTNRGSA